MANSRERGRAQAECKEPGRQRKYSNHAIETAVTLGMVFHLPSRQTEGFLRSLFQLLKLDNDVPDHTTISRRKAKLGKITFYESSRKTPSIHPDRQQRPGRSCREVAQATKEQGLSQAPSLCGRTDWRSRRQRTDEQTRVRCVASPAACRPNREAHLIGQSGTAHTTRAASMKRWTVTVLIARRGC